LSDDIALVDALLGAVLSQQEDAEPSLWRVLFTSAQMRTRIR
jgi:hypothetical protein